MKCPLGPCKGCDGTLEYDGPDYLDQMDGPSLAADRWTKDDCPKEVLLIVPSPLQQEEAQC